LLVEAAGKKVQHSCAPAREECNKHDDVTACSLFFDWPIIMIRPGGLLLVVLTYFQFDGLELQQK
jgi:hypothetical protein